MKIKSFLLSIMLVARFGFAQNYEESSIMVFETRVVNSNFLVYDPPFPAKGIYKDTLEAVNQFPEQVISSIMSATNQAWENFNYLNGQARKLDAAHFEKAAKLDKNKNYYELRSKFEFIHEGSPTAFIKYYFHFEDLKEQGGGFKVLKKVNGKWYATLIPNFITVPYMLFWFKDERLKELFAGKPTGNPFTDDIITKTRDESGNLDLEKLGNQLRVMFKEGTKTPKFLHFIDPVTFKFM